MHYYHKMCKYPNRVRPSDTDGTQQQQSFLFPPFAVRHAHRWPWFTIPRAKVLANRISGLYETRSILGRDAAPRLYSV